MSAPDHKRGLNGAGAWLVRPQANPQARLRLFCFPYAGGGASVYYPWAARLAPAVEVCAIQLPGREHRLAEPLVTRLVPLLEALEQAVLRDADRPFAFFGHSLGALIGFELARRLFQQHGVGPAHLFVSGRPAPQLRRREPPIHHLPEPDFIARLRRYNGTPEVILQDAELRELFLPILRADFSIIETYSYVAGPPLRCPITALGGLEDGPVGRDDLAAWRDLTSERFNLHMFPGDHFFLRGAQTAVLQVLSHELTQTASAANGRVEPGTPYA